MGGAIAELVNTDVGFDPLDAYLERLDPVTLCRRPYEAMATMIPQAGAVLETF